MILVCKIYYIILVSACFQADDQILPFIVSKKQNHLKNFKKENTFSDWIQPMYVEYCLHWDVAKIVICKLFNLLSRYKLHKILHSFEEKKLTLELTDFKRIATNFK